MYRKGDQKRSMNQNVPQNGLINNYRYCTFALTVTDNQEKSSSCEANYSEIGYVISKSQA